MDFPLPLISTVHSVDSTLMNPMRHRSHCGTSSQLPSINSSLLPSSEARKIENESVFGFSLRSSGTHRSTTLARLVGSQFSPYPPRHPSRNNEAVEGGKTDWNGVGARSQGITMVATLVDYFMDLLPKWLFSDL